MVLQARPGTDIPRRIPASCHNKHARRVIYRQERPRSTRERSRPTRKSERNRIGCILRQMSRCVTRLRAATSRTRPLAPARVLSLPPSLHPPPHPRPPGPFRIRDKSDYDNKGPVSSFANLRDRVVARRAFDARISRRVRLLRQLAVRQASIINEEIQSRF